MERSKSKVFTYVILAVVVVIIGSVLVFTSIGKTSKNQITSTVQASTTIKATTTVHNSGRALAEPPSQPCAIALNPINSSRITNGTGLTLWTYTYTGAPELVIGPNSIGRLYYNLSIGGTYIPNAMYDINSNIAYTQIYNALNGSNSINPSLVGITISYLPGNEILTNNDTIPLNVTISTTSNAPEQPYWIWLSPGVCMGNSNLVLLTVGTEPYNGSGAYLGSSP